VQPPEGAAASIRGGSTIRRPRFSVLIAARDSANQLERALRSIDKQTCRDFEVVVVDSGSSEIGEIVREACPQAVVLRLQEGGGVSVARNLALRNARGEIAAFLDIDAVWHPHYLAYHDHVYRQASDALFVFCDYFGHGPDVIGPVRQLADSAGDDTLANMVLRPFVHTLSCFTAPLDDVSAVGGFSESLGRLADLDLYIRLLAGEQKDGDLACFDRPVVGLPHILVLRDTEKEDRPLDHCLSEWEADKRAFLDRAFAYDFMKPYHDLRSACAARLDDVLARYIEANFMKLDTIPGGSAESRA